MNSNNDKEKTAQQLSFIICKCLIALYLKQSQGLLNQLLIVNKLLIVLLLYVGMVQAIVVVFCESQHMKQGRRKRNLFFLEYHFLENFVNVTGIRFLLLHRKELINIFLNYSYQ